MEQQPDDLEAVDRPQLGVSKAETPAKLVAEAVHARNRTASPTQAREADSNEHYVRLLDAQALPGWRSRITAANNPTPASVIITDDGSGAAVPSS